jgi:hypothetical protein
MPLGSRDGRDVVRSFVTDRRGAVAVIFCLCATVLLGLVGGSVDYARLAARRTQLQGAVDAGALAGGNALKLALSSTAAVILAENCCFASGKIGWEETARYRPNPDAQPCEPPKASLHSGLHLLQKFTSAKPSSC